MTVKLVPNNAHSACEVFHAFFSLDPLKQFPAIEWETHLFCVSIEAPHYIPIPWLHYREPERYLLLCSLPQVLPVVVQHQTSTRPALDKVLWAHQIRVPDVQATPYRIKFYRRYVIDCSKWQNVKLPAITRISTSVSVGALEHALKIIITCPYG